jgi:hypothetical protein
MRLQCLHLLQQLLWLLLVADVPADPADLTLLRAAAASCWHLQVSVNEEVDPAAIIRRLKQEVRDLKDELQLLKGGATQRGPLTPDELLRLRQQLLAFVADSSAGASLNLGGDNMMIRASESGC